jgi:hypothetical protein
MPMRREKELIFRQAREGRLPKGFRDWMMSWSPESELPDNNR